MDVHKDGEHLLEYKMRSHSWVRNGYNLLTSQITGLDSSTGGATYGAGSLEMKDISDAIQCAPSYLGYLWYNNNKSCYAGAAGESTKGIVVGTGTNADSFEDNKLGTLITSGTGSGQLSYAVASAGTGAYDAASKKITVTHSRYFNNNSGSAIVVSEVGIYAITANVNVMLCRDLLSTPVSVLNAAQLTVTYTMEVTYPA
jgi:hypothetical protein